MIHNNIHWLTRRARLAAAVLILICAVLPSLLVLSSGYAYDDELVVKKNPTLQMPLRRALIETADAPFGMRAFGPAEFYYRPLLTISILLTDAVVPNAPMRVHRMVSTIIHAINSLLVSFVSAMLLHRWGLSARRAESAGSLTGLLFATAAPAGEALGLVAARNDLLVLMFVLSTAAVALWADYRKRTHVILVLLSAYTFLVAALLSKETVAATLLVAPFFVALAAGTRNWRAVTGSAVICVASLCTWGGIRVWHGVSWGESVFRQLIASSGACETRSFAQYVMQFSWPRYILFVNPEQPLRDTVPKQLIDVVGTTTGVIGLALLLVIAARQTPPLGLACLLWIAVWLGPVLLVHGSDPAYEMTERFLYTSAVPVWIMTATALSGLMVRWHRMRPVFLMVLVTGMLASAMAQAHKASIWSDNVKLWRTILKMNPGMQESLYYYAVALYDTGNREEAKEALREVVTRSELPAQRHRAAQLLENL